MSPLSSRWIQFGWFVTGIVGIAVVILLAVRERGQAAADLWVNHTLEVVGTVEQTKSDVRGASNELRGYVLTGQLAWLAEYRRHLALAGQSAAAAETLLRDNPSERDRALRMREEIRQYGEWSEKLLGIYRAQGLSGAAAVIGTGRGETAQASVDQLANAMLTAERGLLAVRQRLSARLRRVALWLEVLLGLLVIGQVVASGFLARARYEAARREQETLRQSQIYAESIVATIREPLVVLDSYLRVVSANRAFYQLLQTSPERTEGLPWTEIAGAMWNIPDLIARLYSVIDEREQMESFRLARDFAGLGPRQLLLNARKVYQPGVRSGLILLVIEDETERARTEQRLKDTNAELQAFAYSIAHDLRAPLRGMQGFSEALHDDYAAVLDETGRSYTVRIATAARRMDDLIRDLLDYSRLARGELALEAVQFNQVVAAARQQLSGVLLDSGASLTVAEDLPVVVGHFGTLVQILANLVGNSIKFVAPGVVPAISIRAEAHGNVRRILVEDNGIGVAPQFHEKIFGVFERLHGPEEYPGTGIGLAVVRKGIEPLGGKSGVESAAGRGACFWIELNSASAPTR
jgi:signal transduction histidine kinase